MTNSRYDWSETETDENNDDELIDDDIRETQYDQINDMMEPPDIPDVNEEPPTPDATLLKERTRSRKEREYSKKIRKAFGLATRATITRPATVPDAAAFLLYGPKISDSLGRIAAEHDKAAGAIDIIDTIGDNPYIGLAMSLSPLVLQLARNHETLIKPEVRTIKLLGREWKLPRIGFTLGVARNFSNDPDNLVQYVLGNPEVQKALKRNGITLDFAA